MPTTKDKNKGFFAPIKDHVATKVKEWLGPISCGQVGQYLERQLPRLFKN